MNRGGSIFQPRVTVFTKADVTAATAWTTGNSPITLFTVTGDVLINVGGVVTTALNSTGNTGTLAVGVSGLTGALIAATTVDGTKLHTAGFTWTDTNGNQRAFAMPGTTGWYLVSGSNIILSIATNSMTSGGMTLYAIWIPLSAGASVV